MQPYASLRSNAPVIFEPPRRTGLVVHAALLSALLALTLFNLWQTVRAPMGAIFLTNLLLALLSALPIPLVFYRMRALQTAVYELSRDGIVLRWGLRSVELPMPTVLWVRRAEEVLANLPLPPLIWHGALVGTALRPARGLPPIEFLAARRTGLLLIATEQRVYAISPADPESFLHTIHRLLEYGSITPIAYRSRYPLELLREAWQSRPLRALFVANIGLNAALLTWVSLSIPRQTTIRLGFDAAQQPGVAVAAAGLLLLPFLSMFFSALNGLLGLYFFRREPLRFLAYLLWISGAFFPALFLLAVGFILQNG
ncbi:MAG: hypothetical protein OHK0052_07810 [Anaerolineales bacterium]